MQNTIYKESLSSLNILIKLFGEERVYMNENCEILLDGIVLLNDDCKKLLLFCNKSKTIRRKNKDVFSYLNFFQDSSKLVDYFLEEYSEYEDISITFLNNYILLSLKNIHNKEFEFIKLMNKEENKSNDYYITKYIKTFLEEKGE